MRCSSGFLVCQGTTRSVVLGCLAPGAATKRLSSFCTAFLLGRIIHEFWATGRQVMENSGLFLYCPKHHVQMSTMCRECRAQNSDLNRAHRRTDLAPVGLAYDNEMLSAAKRARRFSPTEHFEHYPMFSTLRRPAKRTRAPRMHDNTVDGSGT